MTSTAGDIRLRLFNTLTRQVADFAAATPPQVGMYTCGPTVYADQHIGNMRTYVFADTLKRVLTWKGYRVRHVINITDVGHLTSDADEGDDKLELAARRERQDAWKIAERYTRDFKTDLERLRIVKPDVWCKGNRSHPADDQVRRGARRWRLVLPAAIRPLLRHLGGRWVRDARPP